ncbi:hypothetical protein [Allorhodopirellula heiligendammensis]|uniref:Antitoxin VbhA domain-containing protein n=1 Tax=Allorhodopirellula heiligendammensis TaxID=2714739 RepID=A0A5C6BD09_9BACT|nr:hypothetical protein [Allorhodopirellula heiligendammensis]TWU09938.1 hypothetical protein Poly21_52660 [Allorhodopirellula heiligendammensis]
MKNEIDEFRLAWLDLSREGKCDVVNGDEYQRVLTEWQEAGSPADIAEFIAASTSKSVDGSSHDGRN